MKNIHVLPTDKPSRLYFNVNDKEFQVCEIEKPSTILKPNRHIYITSDEEIKEGDCFLSCENTIEKYKGAIIPIYLDKKIILTTDQDLIKDGVQAIDDEFLEWFVKNPSCEEIEVISERRNWKEINWITIYKIIIPKEEPKFENSIDNTMNIISIANSMFGKKEEPNIIHQWLQKNKNSEIDKFVEKEAKQMYKQETLEVMKDLNYYKNNAEEDYKGVPISVLRYINELEKRQERMYSEEEVIDLLQEMNDWPTTFEGRIEIKEWFQPFKKK